MKNVLLLITACAAGVSLNLPLMVRNEEVLLSVRPAEDGWRLRCLYYRPFEFKTIEIPHYQRCDPVRNEGSYRRQGTFFWEQKA